MGIVALQHVVLFTYLSILVKHLSLLSPFMDLITSHMYVACTLYGWCGLGKPLVTLCYVGGNVLIEPNLVN